MSHKGKNSASSGKGKKASKPGAETKSEDVLQAVVGFTAGYQGDRDELF